MIPTTQRAAQFNPDTKKVEVNTIDVPTIADDELLIRTIAASLCHSDIMVIEGKLPSSDKPVTIGHEATGEVLKVGSAVKGFKVGDNIGFINAYHACFSCEACSAHYTFCTSGKMVMQGFATNGYFQEYCVIDPGTAVVLPSKLDASTCAPIFCAGITAYNSMKAAKIKPGQWVAIVGCGGLGQLGIQYAKAMGAKVIGIDIDDDTLATAKASGATETFNSRSDKDFIAKISALTNGGCSDVVVYTAVKAGYDVAPKLVRIGGNFVVVGVTSDDIHLSTLDLTMSRYRLVTANNAATPPLLRECAEFTAEHGISSPSKFFKLDQIGEMIEIMNKEKMAGARLAVKF